MRKQNLKGIALILTLLMSLTLVGCGNSNNSGGSQKHAETVKLHVAATTPPEHSYTRAAQPWAKEITEATDGIVKPLLEFGGVHGGERQTVEMCMRGDLDMVWAADMAISAVIPELGYTNLPYLFKDYKETDELFRNGWIGEEFAKKCEEKGLVVLAYGENDFRGLTNSKHPIKSAADMKGLKIRVPETPMFLSFFNELGALPTPMAVTELATALQQKTVDGQDNGAIITYTFGFPSFNKYVTKTNHMWSSMAIIINKAKFESLTPEQQQALRDLSKKWADEQVKMNREDVDKFYQAMIDESNCEVIDRTPELEADFKAAATKVWNNEKVVGVYGKEIMDRLKKEAGF